MIHSPLFEKNLNRLMQKDPLTAHRIGLGHFDQIQVCQTKQNEPNLCVKRYQIASSFHDQSGALDEARAIVPQILPDTEALFFYGLGLGYIYDALRDWLKENPKRHLIFCEDQLEVIFHFLHTERAAQVLDDPQVTLFHITDITGADVRFYQLISRFAYHVIQFLALPYYASKREEEAFNLCYRILYDQDWLSHIHAEYLSGQRGFLQNFYSNLLSLPQSYLGSGLFGKFKGIPAIICGAGPSIHKNIELLKTLSNRALIFAGGSSLNVLNAYQLAPHFGLGIDPNPEQIHRLLTNDTFHLNYFYRNRLTHQAFDLMQGDKLYVPGSFNLLANWFEQQMGIDMPEGIDEGHNVVNFCTEIARLMGCNPIIYVGLDLALGAKQPYASGISTHPLWLGRSDPYKTSQQEQYLKRVGIDGQPLLTRWAWAAESTWLGRYAATHPDVQMLNATEGGIGFYPVPNLSLAEVARTYLNQSYELSGLIHTEIQNHSIHISRQRVIDLIRQLKMSLENCRTYCSQIIEEAQALYQAGHPQKVYTNQAILFESLLQQEIGYQCYLKPLNDAYLYHYQASFPSTRPDMEDQLKALMGRYDFLRTSIGQHLNLLIASVQYFIFHASHPNPKKQSQEAFKHEDTPPIDESIRLECQTETYPDGTIKSEVHFFQGELYGPSRFFSDQGQLLMESGFIKGKQEGRTTRFYKQGGLYSLESYCHGLRHGKQEYFFEDGSPNVVMHYKNGLLDGPVHVYNRDGQLIRELHYQAGKREGLEKMWDHDGHLLMRCQYKDGTPFGKAQEWDRKGHLIKEVTIHQYPAQFDSFEWNEQGEIMREFKQGVENTGAYFERVQTSVEHINQEIAKLVESLSQTAQKQELSGFSKDIEEVKLSLEQLYRLQNELNQIKERQIQRFNNPES